MEHEFDFYTSYHQFYLEDKGSPAATASNNFWTPSAYNDKLAIEKGCIGVGIGSYGHVKLRLKVLTDPPDYTNNFNTVDHVVEGGLEIKSGILRVVNCPINNVELEVKITPGIYRVRVYSFNLASADIDEDDADDYYKIEMWPANNMERKVLKRYVRPTDN